MSLAKLSLTHFRNLEQIDFCFESPFILIAGPNGSGKTAILEAIYLLAHGRSFRSRHISRIIQHEKPNLCIFAEINTHYGQSHRVGIERSNDTPWRIRIDQQQVANASALATYLPLQLLNPNSYKILEEGSKHRRQLLDWLIFYSEPHFFPLWRQCQQLIKQRNAALRQQQPENQLSIWDETLIPLAEQLTAYRKKYFQQIIPLFEQTLAQIYNGPKLSLDYYQGWSKSKTLTEALESSFESDSRLGYTHSGPHRADLMIKSQGVPVRDILSRGQQKMLVYSLQLSLGLALRQNTEKSCLFLLDDLPAELDQHHLNQILSFLSELNSQVFITTTDESALSNHLSQKQYQLFHVEQQAKLMFHVEQ